MKGTWHRVGPPEALAAGVASAHTLAGREIAICRTNEGVFAVEDQCPHAEARLSEGRLRGCRITCLLHGASFDLRDGRVLGGPARAPLRTYPVRIADGFVEVLLPDADVTTATGEAAS
jgi:nitrite reductase/ring-hydroxylating ferredoxin subunit